MRRSLTARELPQSATTRMLAFRAKGDQGLAMHAGIEGHFFRTLGVANVPASSLAIVRE
jgi:hypothetical protein